MPRATTKKELLETATNEYNKLWELINSLSDKDQNKDFDFPDKTIGKEAHWKRDKNIRDILIHLYEWHQLLLCWVSNNISGKKASFLIEPYTWKTYGDMNIEFWKKHQETTYEKVKDLFRNSHKKVIELIEKFSDEELFTKNYFKWTKGSTLGQYCTSATSSHYNWASKKIKLYIKNL